MPPTQEEAQKKNPVQCRPVNVRRLLLWKGIYLVATIN